MKLNEVQNVKELSAFLHFPAYIIKKILYEIGTENYYHNFKIPKKGGGERIISKPVGDLDDLQHVILFKLNEFIEDNNIKFTRSSMAYQKEINSTSDKKSLKGIYNNALFHKNKNYILNLDLENFFPTIHFGRIAGFFERNTNFCFSHKLATILANIMCYKGKLPQGACTSPIISNLICNTLDIHILKISKKYKLTYTRYADDLSFSTNDHKFINYVNKFLEQLNMQIERDGFHVNWKKLNLSGPDVRHMVTGLVNNKQVGVKKEYYKETRAMVDSLFKKGFFKIDGVEYRFNDVDKLEGRLAFINDIDHRNLIYEDKKAKKNKRNIQNPNRNSLLSSREKLYEKFLFFRHFWNPNTPVIVTEGKTDIIYLKKALQVTETLLSEVTFFKSSKLLEFFFRLYVDGGGNAMNSFLYMYFNRAQELPKFFRNFSSPTQPVIVLFDHEMTEDKNEKGPIRDFLNLLHKIANSEENKKNNSNNFIVDKVANSLNEHGFVHLVDNLYVAVIKKDNSNVNDLFSIEDLFPEDCLKNVFGMGVFETKKTISTPQDQIISKNDFSKIIRKRNDNIFDGFKPTLQVIQNIIDDYEIKK